MSPRPTDPDARAAMLAGAARLLAAEGPSALTTRRLAAEAGTSTMAVYTRFGSLLEVHRAVRADGFARLESRLERVTPSGDPVADLAVATMVYLDFAIAEPHLYRAMTIDRPPPEEDADARDPGEGVFAVLSRHVRQCLADGRFRGDASPATMWSAQLWTMQHGTATLVLTGTVAPDTARAVLEDMVERLCLGYGDAPARARGSVAAAAGRRRTARGGGAGS